MKLVLVNIMKTELLLSAFFVTFIQGFRIVVRNEILHIFVEPLIFNDRVGSQKMFHDLYYYFQILSTMFQYNFDASAVIDAELTNELLFQCCQFVTDVISEFRNMYTHAP